VAVLSRAAAVALLAGPAVIAFFSGGYFDEARLVGAILAWLLVAVAAALGLTPRRESRLMIAGLAALTVLTGLSIAWAPLENGAFADFQRLVLYLGVLVAACSLLRQAWVRPLVEPVLAGGAFLVVAYGLSERLLPGLITLERSAAAGGRLQQPLTYWNAVGALAAIGAVLCVRLAGDARRPAALRAAAAAASVPLALGLWLSFSRGALAAAGVGLLALVLAAPTRAQVRAIAICVLAALPAIVATAALDGVRTYAGSLGSREGEGLLMIFLLAVSMTVAAVLARRSPDARAFALPRRAPLIAGLAVVVAVGVVVAAGIQERHPGQAVTGATTQRLGSVESNRYAYWRVAFDTFADHPLVGDGAHSFEADWLQHRDIQDSARDAHSLYFETAAELGLAGLAALFLFLGAAGVAAVRAWRRDPALAAGPIAAVCVWLFHAALDWDWEMPAVSLVALLLIGALAATPASTTSVISAA
jgi:O-antigen ligase/polysaccharide polymerase Wzy-like membrane protein